MENLIISSSSKPPLPIPIKSDTLSESTLKPTNLTISITNRTHPKAIDTQLNYLSRNGCLSEAIAVLDSSARHGFKVRPNTYVNLLQSCIDSDSIELGRELHARIHLVWEINPFVTNKLVNMYAKCGCLDDARRVFDDTSGVNLYVWSAMISACLEEQRWREVLELFVTMMEDRISPDAYLLAMVLHACGNCGNVEAGKSIHSLAIRLGMNRGVRFNNAVLGFYSKCGDLSSARRFFDKMSDRDTVAWNSLIMGYCRMGDSDKAHKLLDAMREEGVELSLITWNTLIASYNQWGRCDEAMELMREMGSLGISPDVCTWTSMISGFSQHNRAREALGLFKDMILAGVEPNFVTIMSACSACASLKALEKCLEIHSVAVKMGFINDLLVRNSLVDMYAKCGDLETARVLFEIISEKDVYTWNSMIAGYCHAGYCGKACELFMEMQNSGLKPNVITWNTMISGYMQSGDEDRAMDLFQRMEKDGNIKRNVASWNSLIAGYVQLGQRNKALGIFRQMQSFGVSPNSVTILSVLPACANLVAVKKVKEIHGFVLCRNLKSVLSINNSLIDSYANSGNIAYSRAIFDRMPSKDVITWNSMIAGYVLHGCSDAALDLYDQMRKLGHKPNRGTFVSVLFALGLAGKVDEGRQVFSSISENYKIIAAIEHYLAMVYLYGRSGRLQEAIGFIQDMPIEPDPNIWDALLIACRIHGNISLAIWAAEHLLDLEPGNFLIYELLLQTYALCGRLEDASRLRKLQNDNKVPKLLGQSWTEVKNMVHTFVAGDCSQPQPYSCNLYSQVQSISSEAGAQYSDHRLCVEEEEKEDIVGFHSEKLALAYALTESSCPPQSIRIVKNMRMCGDCHRTAKFISLRYGCEIYVNDSKCFHHFKRGHCSCGDYW